MQSAMVRLLSFIVTLGYLYCANGERLEVAFQWKYLDWTWPNVHLTGKNQTLGNAFTQDVDVDRYGRVFVTSPQWLDGVPISLSLITTAYGLGGPLLTPYPDWTWHTPYSCDSIISVYRLAVNIVTGVIAAIVARISITSSEIAF